MRRALIALALLTTACNGDGGSSVDTNAPVISNLRQNALPPNRQGTPQVFSVDYQDRGGDITQGICEVTVRGDTNPSQLSFVPGSTAETGSVVCVDIQLFRATPAPVTVPVTVVLIDGSGHRSNALTVTAVVETTTP